MRRVRDGFANRFAKPSRTVAKRSHGIAKSSHASRTRRERVAKVLNMLYFFVRQNLSQNRRQVIAYVANPSPTRRQPFADVRKHIARKFPRSEQCDKYATKIRPFRDLIAINKTDQNSHERRATLARMSHDCRETLARISRDCRETLARMSHDCRAIVINIIEYMSRSQSPV